MNLVSYNHNNEQRCCLVKITGFGSDNILMEVSKVGYQNELRNSSFANKVCTVYLNNHMSVNPSEHMVFQQYKNLNEKNC